MRLCTMYSWKLTAALAVRYANIDYVFASAIRATYLLIFSISYDIVCQWFVNLFRRMQHWPPELKLLPGMQLRRFIPKFHAPAHNQCCCFHV